MATIYEVLREKLGREPTNAELRADVERIKAEASDAVRASGFRLRIKQRRRRR